MKFYLKFICFILYLNVKINKLILINYAILIYGGYLTPHFLQIDL